MSAKSDPPFHVSGTATGRMSSDKPNFPHHMKAEPNLLFVDGKNDRLGGGSIGVIAPALPQGDLTLTGPDGREFIRITPSGEAFVRGEKVAASQHDVYDMFRAWLMKSVGNPKFVPLVPVDYKKLETEAAYKILSDAAARLMAVLDKTCTDGQANAVDDFMLQLKALGLYDRKD